MYEFLRTVAALFLAAATVAGCAEVKPWERGHLATPQMAANPHPLHESLAIHVRESREGLAGGKVAEGGGCGCN